MENQELKQVKEKINREGFEDSTAVVVGPKEEAENARLRLETEGMTKDLATYIKLHKNIIATSDDIKKFSIELGYSAPNFQAGRYDLWGTYPRMFLRYVDKDLNIAEVEIDFGKIDEFKEWEGRTVDMAYLLENMEKALSELGFNYDREFAKTLSYVTREYEKKREIEIKKEKREGFDF